MGQECDSRPRPQELNAGRSYVNVGLGSAYTAVYSTAGHQACLPGDFICILTCWRSKAERIVPNKFPTVSHTTSLKTGWNAHCIPAHTILDSRSKHALLLVLQVPLPRCCRPQACLIDGNGIRAERPPPTAVRRHLDGPVHRVQRKPNPRAVRDPRPYRSKRVSSTMTTLRLPSRSSGLRPGVGFDVDVVILVSCQR